MLKRRTELANLSQAASASTLSKSQKKQLKAEQKQRAKELRQLKRQSRQSNAHAKKQIVARKAPAKTSDCLHFERMFENGICEVEPGLYSATLAFSDVNYQIARREEQANIFTRYCELLNYCDPTMHLQISLITQHMDEAEFRRDTFLPMTGAETDSYRKELNHIVADKAMEGQNGLLREKYVTFSVQGDDYDTAVQQLTRRTADVRAQFKGLHSNTRQLAGLERLRLLHGVVRPGEPMGFAYDWLLAEPNLTTKDFIAPSGYDWKPVHDDSSASYSDRYRFGDNIGKTIYLRDIAPQMDDDLLSRLCELPFNLAIAVHVDAMEQHDAIELVKTKLAYMKQEEADGMVKAVRQRMPPVMGVRQELMGSIANAENLLDDLMNHNQKLFKLCVLVHTYGANNAELDERVRQIISTVEKKTCKFDTIPFQQEDAMNSILPLGKKWIGLERTLTTANAAIFIPFTTQELFVPGGLYEGLNARSKSLILFNRKLLPAPAGMILGMTGFGKSVAVKLQIAGILMRWPEDDVIILDPESEYGALVKAFGGVEIEISASSKSHINPMDITEDYADDDDPILLKSQFLQSFCQLIQHGIPLTAQERTQIDRAAQRTYQRFLDNPGKQQMPSLREFYDNLTRQGPIAENIATALSMYVDGTMDIFAHQSNVDVQNHCISFNTVKLGKSMQTIGMMTVLDQVWNRVTRNRALGRRTWIFTDEFQLLLANKDCTNFYFELSSRARKWGAILTSITQHVRSVLNNEDARRMLSDCSYIKLLNQAPDDAKQLGELLKISEEELAYVTDVEVGSGLLIAGKTVVPFTNDFPRDTELFRLMDTSPAVRDTKTRV